MPRRDADVVARFHAVRTIRTPGRRPKHLTQPLLLSGHGTYVDGDEVVASVAGTIERVNKLISVRAARTR